MTAGSILTPTKKRRAVTIYGANDVVSTLIKEPALSEKTMLTRETPKDRAHPSPLGIGH